MSNEIANQGAAAPHMRLVIDRARWLRGEGSDDSFLLRSSDGQMCCLGFYGLSCGVPVAELTDRPSPTSAYDAPPPHGAWPSWLFQSHSVSGEHDLASWDLAQLMGDNDDPDLPPGEREEAIAEVFAKHGVTVEFVGDAAPAAPKEPQP